MEHSKFVVVKGQPLCLTRGFEYLKKGAIPKKIQTIDYTKTRMFKLVDVDEYDEPFRLYTNMGRFWADAVTGTLYDPKTGECLSSDQIKLLVK